MTPQLPMVEMRPVTEATFEAQLTSPTRALSNDLSARGQLRWLCDLGSLDRGPPGASCRPEGGFTLNLGALHVLIRPLISSEHPEQVKTRRPG